MGGAHVQVGVSLVEQVGHLVQQGVVAAHHHQGVLQLLPGPQERDGDPLPRLQALLALGDVQNAVGLQEGGHHPGPTGQRGGHQLIPHLAQTHPNKLPVFQPRHHPPGQHCLRLLPGGGFLAGPVFDEGAEQVLQHQNAADRVAGHPQHRHRASPAQNGGLAGADGQPVAQHLPHRANDGGGIVLPARRRPGVEHHQVALLRGPGEGVSEVSLVVLHDGVGFGRTAPFPDHGGEDGGVELQHVPRLGVVGGRHHLVPGGDDPHHRAGEHLHRQHATGDHGPDGGGGNGGMGGEEHLPGAHVLPDLPDVLPGGGGLMEDGLLPLPQHVLDHHHRVLPLGQGVTGVHHRELMGFQGHRRGLGGPEGIRRRHGDAIHGAGGIVGGAQGGVDRPGSHPARRLRHRHRLGFGLKSPLRQPGGVALLRLLQGEVGQISKGHKNAS